MLLDDVVKIGQKRWLLFEAGKALFNGYDQDTNSEELDECTLIEVEILTTLLPYQHQSRSTKRTWIEVLCHQVVPLAHIPDVFPAIPPSSKGESALASVDGQTVTRYQTRTQEEHEWHMVTNAGIARHALPHLVLLGFSMDSYCTICNWAVDLDEYSWRAS